MKRERITGFTVIETMLFLAVSGMLVVGILVGAGAAVNAQRYKDAHHSLISFLQGEYDRAARVQNDRPSVVGCIPADKKLAENNASAVLGTSACTIIGRLVEVDSSSGKSVTSRPVYAAADRSSFSGDDNSAFAEASLFVDPLGGVEHYVPEWDTKIVQPKSDNSGNWRLLIARSPSSGIIHTYVTTNQSLSVGQIATSVNKSEVTVCVHPQGLVSFERKGLVINRDGAGATAVKDAPGGAC